MFVFLLASSRLYLIDAQNHWRTIYVVESNFKIFKIADLILDIEPKIKPEIDIGTKDPDRMMGIRSS